MKKNTFERWKPQKLELIIAFAGGGGGKAPVFPAAVSRCNSTSIGASKASTSYQRIVVSYRNVNLAHTLEINFPAAAVILPLLIG